MAVVAVVGGQWGDEGKGKIIDLLAAKAQVVIRAQGGDNAGHTVVNPRGKFALHLVPAGIFNPKTLCVIGAGVALNPQILLEEMDALHARGVDTSNLIISERTHLVMPYHLLLDQAEEQARGAAKIGTTGRGIGPAYSDKGGRVGLRTGVLIEGAHGTLLDLDYGTYPYVTTSSPTVAGLLLGAGIAPRHLTTGLGVFKAYQTRVGAGPMPTELHDEVGEAIRRIGHEYGTTTGRPRRCGWVDAVAARYSARVNGFDSLAITRLDILDALPTLKICTAYELDGRRIEEFPSRTEVLARCLPIYEELEGWRTSTSGANSWSDLPPAARRYVERIGALLDVPVGIVGVGEGREQSIVIEQSAGGRQRL